MGNTATGSAEAGFYVGDSPDANAKVSGNEASGALFGVFVRHAEGGSITSNRLHDNCVGVVVLADAPGPAGNFDISNNRISHNTKLCDEEPPAVSGVGVALIGAHDVTISNNNIVDNLPGGPADITGGVDRLRRVRWRGARGQHDREQRHRAQRPRHRPRTGGGGDHRRHEQHLPDQPAERSLRLTQRCPIWA